MDGGAPKLGKRAAQRAASKVRLLGIARQAFSEMSYAEVTMRRLAELGGVSTGSYFVHWPDKSALFVEATGRAPPHALEAIAPAVADFLETVAIKCAGRPDLEDMSENAMLLRMKLMGA